MRSRGWRGGKGRAIAPPSALRAVTAPWLRYSEDHYRAAPRKLERLIKKGRPERRPFSRWSG